MLLSDQGGGRPWLELPHTVDDSLQLSEIELQVSRHENILKQWWKMVTGASKAIIVWLDYQKDIMNLLLSLASTRKRSGEGSVVGAGKGL